MALFKFLIIFSFAFALSNASNMDGDGPTVSLDNTVEEVANLKNDNDFNNEGIDKALKWIATLDVMKNVPRSLTLLKHSIRVKVQRALNRECFRCFSDVSRFFLLFFFIFF